MKFLHRLKKEQYQFGADAALSNAKDHLAVSKMCASNNIIGIANSHLIIACEELCKASILRVKSLLPQVSISDFNQYFYSHEVKHKKIWEIYSAVYQLSDSRESRITANQESSINNDNWKILLFIILALAIIAFTNKDKENPEMSLEEMRIRGFYVDLKDDKSWLVPNLIFSLDDFNNHLEVVQTIFTEIETKLFNKDISGSELNNIATQLGYLKTKLDAE